MMAMRSVRNLLVIASLGAGLLAYVACDDITVNARSACTAGETQACVCPSGTASTQTCWGDGTYGECACGQTFVGVPLESGVVETAPETSPAETIDETAIDAAPDLGALPDDAVDDTSTEAAADDAGTLEAGETSL